MTRLHGKLLNVEDKDGVSKEGKPYFMCNLLVLDQDNEVAVVRVFDRDGSLRPALKKLKVGDEVTLKVDKIERLPNRTFDAQGQLA